jgi:hypothetical protein
VKNQYSKFAFTFDLFRYSEVVWAGRVDRERIYLKNVFGFCKLALQTGCPLVGLCYSC